MSLAGPTEVNVGQNGKAQSIPAIVDEANKIWKKVKDAKVPITDYDGCDALWKRLCEEHKDFKLSLPLVLKTMVTTKNYNSKALERYLKKLAVDMKNFRSMDDYLKSQAEYFVFLYKASNKHYSQRDVALIREQGFQQLKEEYEEIQKIAEEAEEEAKRLAEEANEKRRQDLYKQLLQQKTSDL